MNWIYSEEVKKHFFEPQNMLDDEENFAASGVGEVGSLACGDLMKVWVRVDEEVDKIVEMRWQTFGCASAIASTSMLSVMVNEAGGGMPIDEALKITPKQILERLGGLPDKKVHCSVLGDKALRAALENYFERTAQLDRIEKKKAKVLCGCIGVTDKDVEEAVLDGAEDFEMVQKSTKVGTGCGMCRERVEEFIDETRDKYFAAPESCEPKKCGGCSGCEM